MNSIHTRLRQPSTWAGLLSIGAALYTVRADIATAISQQVPRLLIRLGLVAVDG